MNNIWKLLKFIPHYRSRLAKVVLTNTLLGGLALVIPYLFKNIVDTIAELASHKTSVAHSERLILIYLALLTAIRAVDVLFGYFQERLADTLWIDFTYELRSHLFRKVSDLSIDYFEQTKSGEIVQRFTGGIMEVNRWLFGVSEGTLVTIAQVVFILVYLLSKNWIVGLIMLLVIPFNLFNSVRKVKQTNSIRKRWLELSEKATGHFSEMVTHIATVRSFANEDYLATRHSQVYSEFRKVRIEQSRIEWSANAVRTSVNSLSVIACLYIIGTGAVAGRYTAGDFFLILLLAQNLINSTWTINRLITDTGDVETTAQRLVDLLNVKPTVVDRKGAKHLKIIESIEFQDVSFHYPGKRRMILSNVSFKLSRGQSLALVGPSGTGKSTITKLLMRYYEASSGGILINNEPIESFTQNSLRNLLGVVLQDVALFNDSIEENIRFARPEAKNSELKTAAGLAHADAYIDKLPQKYKTLVGERGIKLSGGEKQRLAIARAILKDPQLIILDEATSALDSESEIYVQEGLASLMTGKTAVIIAHRLSTIMKADIILVLKDGKVTESGSHSELIARKNGYYARLHALQSGSLRDKAK